MAQVKTVMYGYVIFYAYLFPVVSVNGEVKTTIFINSYAPKLCPYTSFCFTKTIMTLDDNTVMTCCLPCSCEANCWKLGNCCPDRQLTDFELLDLPCKATIVKRGPSDKYIYRGHDKGIDRYRINDRCLPNEKNETLIKLCEGENKTTVEENTWVSEENSGRIFQNRYCALCNNISDVSKWQIRTRFSPVFLTNESNVSSIIPLDEYEMIAEIPESQLKLAETYRCLLPSVSKCNVSGPWIHGPWIQVDKGIEWGCETYDSPIFVTQVGRTEIYRNIYCYICNEQTESVNHTVCPSWRSNYDLSDLIDFQYDEEVVRNGGCSVDEIYDQFTKQCRKLICPFGSTALNGKCEYIRLGDIRLTVQISYNIQVLQSLSRICRDDFGSLDKETLGKAIKNKFVEILGFRKGYCDSCGYEILLVDSGQKFLTPEFIIITRHFRAFDCQLDYIHSVAAEVLGKEMKIVLSDCLNFTLICRLEKRSSHAILLLPKSTIFTDLKYCPGEIFLSDNEVICPAVKLVDSDLITWLEKNDHAVSHSLFWVEDHDDDDTVTVCWKHYISFMSQVFLSSSAASLSWTSDKILKTIQPLAAYFAVWHWNLPYV